MPRRTDRRSHNAPRHGPGHGLSGTAPRACEQSSSSQSPVHCHGQGSGKALPGTRPWHSWLKPLCFAKKTVPHLGGSTLWTHPFLPLTPPPIALNCSNPRFLQPKLGSMAQSVLLPRSKTHVAHDADSLLGGRSLKYFRSGGRKGALESDEKCHVGLGRILGQLLGARGSKVVRKVSEMKPIMVQKGIKSRLNTCPGYCYRFKKPFGNFRARFSIALTHANLRSL